MPAIATPSIKAKLERLETVTKDKVNSVHWVCTNCYERIYRASSGTKTPNDYKYCPFCGARFE